MHYRRVVRLHYGGAILLVVLLAALLGAIAHLGWPAVPSSTPARGSAGPSGSLAFEPNVGQTDPHVHYLAHSPAGTLLFAGDTVTLRLPASHATLAPLPGPRAAAPAPPATVQVEFVGARPSTVAGSEPLVERVSYFRGPDPAQWRRNVPTYGVLTYRALYPGIDLRYAGRAGDLKGTYTVAPGADPGAIRWQYPGATVTADPAGNLQIQVGDRQLTEAAPVAWQTRGGQAVPVAAGYMLAADGRLGFRLGTYDPHLPLTIDPSLLWSTYLGGSGEDHGYGIAVDGAGNAYVAGYTDSLNFPTHNPYQPANAGGDDAFVSKFSPDGALLWSTYLGGSGDDRAQRVRVDSAGQVYVVGSTASANFPTVNAYQSTYGGGADDAFVTALAANGQSLLFSTYLGGSGTDLGHSLALDSQGRVVVAGETDSANFPTRAGYQMTYRGGVRDGFVAKLGAAGSSLVWATYLGGSAEDHANALALDPQDAVYVAGQTSSTDYPTINAFQAQHGGGTYDGVVTKLNATGNSLGYSTYLGGSGGENLYAIAVDGTGRTVVAGYTDSGDYPLLNAQQPAYGGGGFDTVVTRFTPNGNTLYWSTYLGGAGYEAAADVALDGSGNVVVGGVTDSPNFPLAGSLEPFPGPGFSGYLTRYTADGQTLSYSTYLGGSGADTAYGVAVDTGDNTYVTGDTSSVDLLVRNAYQPSYGGGTSDGFVLKVSPLLPTATSSPTRTATGSATPDTGPTQTALAGTATAAASQTAGAGTATSIAATRTALPAATQTAVAATQTTVASQTAGAETATAAATQTALARQSPTSTPRPTETLCALTFHDVQPADYFYYPVGYLACHGVVSGYADGTFRPYNTTTRAQMVKISTLGVGLPVYTPPPGVWTFTDVPPGFPFFASIETAAHSNIVNGYNCGTLPNEPCDAQHRPYFRPYAYVTRAQLAKILVITAGWRLLSPPSGDFADLLPGTAFYNFVETAYYHGILSGYSCGGPGEPCNPQNQPYFRQYNDATRGQIAKLAYLAVTNGP